MEIIGNILAYLVLTLLIVAGCLIIALVTKKVIKKIKAKKHNAEEDNNE